MSEGFKVFCVVTFFAVLLMGFAAFMDDREHQQRVEIIKLNMGCK